MPLLNYTTSVDAHKSINEIQTMLAKAGASAILTEFDSAGNINALSFRMKLGDQELSFRLPTDWQPVLETMRIQKRRNSRSSGILAVCSYQYWPVAI